jgi:hypothetical protein
MHLGMPLQGSFVGTQKLPNLSLSECDNSHVQVAVAACKHKLLSTMVAAKAEAKADEQELQANEQPEQEEQGVEVHGSDNEELGDDDDALGSSEIPTSEAGAEHRVGCKETVLFQKVLVSLWRLCGC